MSTSTRSFGGQKPVFDALVAKLVEEIPKVTNGRHIQLEELPRLGFAENDDGEYFSFSQLTQAKSLAVSEIRKQALATLPEGWLAEIQSAFSGDQRQQKKKRETVLDIWARLQALLEVENKERYHWFAVDDDIEGDLENDIDVEQSRLKQKLVDHTIRNLPAKYKQMRLDIEKELDEIIPNRPKN